MNLKWYTAGVDEIPADEQICGLLGRDGTYVRGHIRIGPTPVVTVTKLVEARDIPGAQPVTEECVLHVNRLSMNEFALATAFFSWVYATGRAEAICLLYLHPTAQGGTWKVMPPKQRATRQFVQYVSPLPPRGWFLGGSLHSHASMSAFHSPTDVNDENNTFGFHIVWGAQSSAIASLAIGTWRFPVEPSVLIDLPDTHFPEEWKDLVSIQEYAPRRNVIFVKRTPKRERIVP